MTLTGTLSLRQKLPLLVSGLTAGALVLAGALAYIEVRQSAWERAEERLSSIHQGFLSLRTVNLGDRRELETRVLTSPVVHRALTGLGVDTADLTIALESLKGPEDEGLPVALLRPDGSTVFAIGALPPSVAVDPDPTPPVEPGRSVGALHEVGGEILYWQVSPVPSSGEGGIAGAVTQRRRIGGTETSLALESLLGAGISIRVGDPKAGAWIDLGRVGVTQPPDTLMLDETFVLASADRGEALALATPLIQSPWVLLVEMSMDVVMARPRDFLSEMTVAGGLLLLGVLFASWRMSERLVRPLDGLAAAAEGVARGDYERRVDVRGDDELGRLAATFNAMSERVALSEGALRTRLTEAQELSAHLKEANAVAEAAREEALAANRARAALLAAVSHEVRTPVSAILAFAHLLDGEEDPTAEERRRFARRIGESGDLLAALVNDLLDLSWIESGRLRVDIVEASAPDVVEKAVSALKEKAARKDVTLTCRCPSAAFLGDPQRVQQIVLNLVSNAVKFTPEGGSVTVECASTTEAPPGFDGSRRWLRVDVRDTGVGIAPHQVARIFEPFVQGDGAPRGRSDGDGEHMGAGLGLAISRRLSELMSGTITVESALGRGSRFTLWLPQAMAGTRADEATGGSDAKEPRASARGSSVV